VEIFLFQVAAKTYITSALALNSPAIIGVRANAHFIMIIDETLVKLWLDIKGNN
jgi:hypothetical protein